MLFDLRRNKFHVLGVFNPTGNKRGVNRRMQNKSRASALTTILPPNDERRWTAPRKRAVVIAVRNRELEVREAMTRYQLSEEELAGWIGAYERDGLAGLLVKRSVAHPPRGWLAGRTSLKYPDVTSGTAIE
jgi:hypothetical protein